MSKPSSFCTMATYTVYKQLIGLLLSLSIHHPNAKIYCLVDSKTKKEFDDLSPELNLNISWKIGLDKYKEMGDIRGLDHEVQKEFLNNKPEIMSYALEREKDTLFLDADIFVLDSIDGINHEKDLGVSPHYIKKSETILYGYYNSGCVWTKNKNVPKSWTKHIAKSRYADQTAIEEVTKEFGQSFFEFGENYNLSWWRLVHSEVKQKKIINNISIKAKNEIYYKNKKLKFVHTHFTVRSTVYKNFNYIISMFLFKAKKYRDLLILLVMLQNKFSIYIPSKKKWLINFFQNNSFKKLILSLKNSEPNINVVMEDSGKIFFNPGILLYRKYDVHLNKKEIRSLLKILLDQILQYIK